MYIASQNIIDFPGFDVYKSLIQTSVKGLSEKRQSQTVGFLDLTEDIMQVEAINDFVGKTQDQYDTVIVFGVGGSALGARAFLQAYHGMYWNSLSSDQRGGLAQLYIIDNVDSGEVHQLLQTIDLGRTLINIVSKSGGTLETSLQSAYIIEQMKKSGISDVSQHVVVTTGKETPMETYAQQNNFPVFYIPENVWGRFSVLTPVALLPLAFVGIDLKEVFHGYQISQSCCISSDIDQNRALQLAIYQYYLAQEKHLPMTVMMTYGTEISALGDWYAQLLGESIGKEGYGITPIPATGTTDQHSQLQLYQQGPDDKSYIFIGVDESKKDIQFDSTDNENWKYLENVCFHTAITAAQKWTQYALIDAQRNVIQLQLQQQSIQEIVDFFLVFETQVALLGEMYQINAFDQPGVEFSKIYTKQIITNENS